MGLTLLRLLAIWMIAAATACAAALENASYRADLEPGGTVVVSVPGSPVVRRFAPVFTILTADQDPDLMFQKSSAEAYVVPSWRSGQGQRTMDLYQALTRVETVTENGGTLWNVTI